LKDSEKKAAAADHSLGGRFVGYFVQQAYSHRAKPPASLFPTGESIAISPVGFA
jgi:hypothetical protein